LVAVFKSTNSPPGALFACAAFAFEFRAAVLLLLAATFDAEFAVAAAFTLVGEAGTGVFAALVEFAFDTFMFVTATLEFVVSEFVLPAPLHAPHKTTMPKIAKKKVILRISGLQ
jgi:hypothetical protein